MENYFNYEPDNIGADVPENMDTTTRDARGHWHDEQSFLPSNDILWDYPETKSLVPTTKKKGRKKGTSKDSSTKSTPGVVNNFVTNNYLVFVDGEMGIKKLMQLQSPLLVPSNTPNDV